MVFATEKLAMLIMESGKREMEERIKLPNQEITKMLREKENYKYTLKQSKIKGNTGKESQFLDFLSFFLI